MLNLIRKVASFLGKKIMLLIFFTSMVGTVNFLIEASFVFVLQIFLLNLGILDKSSTFIPEWVPKGQLWGLVILISFGSIKSIVAALRNHASTLLQQEFIYKQRYRLLQLVFYRTGQMSNKEMTTLFGEITVQAGEMIRQSAQLIVTSITAILLFFYGLYLAPREMTYGFLILAVISFPFRTISKKIISSGKDLVDHLTSINDSLLKGLKNNYLLKLYSLQERELTKGEGILHLYKTTFIKYGKGHSILYSIPSFTGTLVVAVLAYLGTQVFNTPNVTLIAFFYIFTRFAQSVSETIQISSFIRLNLEGFKTLYRWHKTSSEEIPSNYSQIPSLEKQIKISAKNIGFSYENKTIFKSINLDITTGDILLIKGKSGSGKSTLLNVLAGMYKSTEGQIFYNNIPGAPANIAELIGYVGPDPYLVYGTIKENLLYGLTKPRSEAELIDCLNKSHMLDMVNSLPLKMETVLSDSAELSTGQKQRLSIARALLRNPKILILDEATSNLDSTTEKQIIANIQELSKDLIILVISHHDSFDSIATQKLSM